MCQRPHECDSKTGSSLHHSHMWGTLCPPSYYICHCHSHYEAIKRLSGTQGSYQAGASCLAPGTACWGEHHSRLCPPSLAPEGFLPPGATRHCCECAVPPRLEGPGLHSSSKGHQKGCSIIPPPALPCYSAVTGHAVAPSQLRCTAPDEETVLDGCQ